MCAGLGLYTWPLLMMIFGSLDFAFLSIAFLRFLLFFIEEFIQNLKAL